MKNRLLQVLVFTSGLTVMAVEMTGLRLLAPYFGTSLQVTTVLIGSLMAFLALGYSLGGKLGDRRPRLDALCRATMLAAAWVVVIPFVAQPILRAASGVLRLLVGGNELSEPAVAFGVLIGGMVGTLALLSVPVTIMGMVSPWAVRLAVEDVEHAGRAAGRLYALSTAGSIVGSFLPALVLVPLFGVRNTFVVVGALFLGVSTLGAWGGLRALLPPGSAALLMLLPTGLVRPMDGLVYERESLYHFIQVVQEPFGRCPEAYHLFLNEGVGVHSVKCLSEGQETTGYWSYLAAAPLWLDEPDTMRDVLVIGLAGGTVVRQLLEAFPEARVDGVEIDGRVVEVGKRFFDDDDPRIRPIVMDGRVFLQASDARYDVVLIDAYRQPYIPFHLITREFFGQVRDHMREDAVLAVNVAGVHGVSSDLSAMVYRTLREVFPTVVLVDAARSNDVIVACTQEKPADAALAHLALLRRSGGLKRIRGRLPDKILAEVEGWERARVLTDDQAPVEASWDLQALRWVR
ncbi:MAG: fused MFS/spermidine synthase [Pseudomonadota bacterium]